MAKTKKTKNNVSKQIIRDVVREQLSGVMGKTLAKATISTVSKKARRVKRKIKDKYSRIPMNTKDNNRSYMKGRSLILGEAANQWVNSYISPFHPKVKNVGLPRPGSMPSQKQTGFLRGTGFIGTNGVGYVYFQPSIVKDRACIGYTTDVYQGTTLLQFGNDIAVAQQLGNTFSPAPGFMTNVAYVNSDIASLNVEGRVVSASLKIRYTGTALNRSGSYYCFVDPDFRSIIGGGHSSTSAGGAVGYSIADLSAQDGCEIFAVSEKSEARIVLMPPANNMFDYPPQNANGARMVYPYSMNQTQFDGATAAAAACIMITGVPGQSFYFEAVTHIEYTGRGVLQSNLSESYSDVVAFDTLTCAIQRAQRNAAASQEGITKCLRKELKAENIVFRQYK